MMNKIDKAFEKWFEQEYNDSWKIYREDGEESHSPLEIKSAFTTGVEYGSKQALENVQRLLLDAENDFDIKDVMEYIDSELIDSELNEEKK